MKMTTNSDIIIVGQYLTSRTEAVRDFLLGKVNTIAVIAIGSAFIDKKENHLFFYKKKTLCRHYIYRHRFLNKIKSLQLLIIFTFFSYIIDIFRSILFLRKKFDIFIGISHFQGLIGIIFKAMNLCKKTIYYSIDYYYTPAEKISFLHSITIKLENFIDRLAVLNSDEVWDISDRISQGRSEFSNLRKEKYNFKNHIVPLGYSHEFFRNRELAENERHSLIFAGVVAEGQGLELMLDIAPELRKDFPTLKIKVIGSGPFLPIFKQRSEECNMNDIFTFYGFIEDVGRMLDIIASCAVGVSLWDEETNGLNFYFGDPGKTKLYSVCSLPVIVSNKTVYARVVTDNHCGIAIHYKRQELMDAIRTLFSDEKKYNEYKSNAIKTALDYCSSEKIFSHVLQVQQ
jgi:glycosyltransferase involved in cell wall biosynthesis